MTTSEEARTHGCRPQQELDVEVRERAILVPTGNPGDDNDRERPPGTWQRYLTWVLAVLAAVSLVLPLAPSAGATAFSLLVYQDTAYPADFPPEAVSYIHLTNAVLGSVMAGWFLTMLGIARRLGSDPSLWRVLAAGLAIWFLPDTIHSVITGYWPNAVLNVAVLALFLAPLAAYARQRSNQAVRELL